MEDGGRRRDLVKSGTESSTLQWPGDLQTGAGTDRQTGAQTARDDRTSMRSDVVSVTESEREVLVNSEKRSEGGANDKNPEKKEEEPVENQLPEKAAQVFTPAVTVLRPSPSSPRENPELWEMESQKSPLLVPQGMPHNYNQQEYQFECDEATLPSTCTCTVLICLWRAGQGTEVVGALIFVLLCQVGTAALPGMS